MPYQRERSGSPMGYSSCSSSSVSDLSDSDDGREGFYRYKPTKYKNNNQNECYHSISVTTDVDLLDVGTFIQLCFNADGSIIEMLRDATLYEYLKNGDLPTKSNINVHCSQ